MPKQYNPIFTQYIPDKIQRIKSLALTFRIVENHLLKSPSYITKITQSLVEYIICIFRYRLSRQGRHQHLQLFGLKLNNF